MKTVFIEARGVKVDIPSDVVESLPKKIALVTTVQFVDSLEDIKKMLVESGREVLLYKGTRSVYDGQMLGCDAEKIDDEVDAVLYIGDGMFHPKMLVIRNEKPVYAYHPGSGRMDKIDKATVERMVKKKKGAILKFMTSDSIGILVTTKPGQYHHDSQKMLEKKYPDKSFYTFVSDTIDFGQLENFTFIDAWVNTACPRIGYDDSTEHEKSIINIRYVL